MNGNETFQSDYSEFMENISTVDAQYPTTQDKEKYWGDFKAYRFITTLH